MSDNRRWWWPRRRRPAVTEPAECTEAEVDVARQKLATQQAQLADLAAELVRVKVQRNAHRWVADETDRVVGRNGWADAIRAAWEGGPS